MLGIGCASTLVLNQESF